jgi:hypothetical protein
MFLGTRHHQMPLLNRLTDWQIVRYGNDSGHRLTCGDPFIRMSRNSFAIVGDQNPMQYCGFSQQWRILQALHCRFLDDDIIQRWNAEP